MIKNWFKKHTYPEQWNDYSKTFTFSHSSIIDEVSFVVLDTETTGLQIAKDRILSLGAVNLKNNRIIVKNALEIYVKQEKFNPETVPIHGLLKSGKKEKIDETSAVFQFLAFVKNSIIVGHHIGFDIAMINQALLRIGLPKLKNKTIDTADLIEKMTDYENYGKPKSLDDLCNQYGIKMDDRHTALGDAYLTAILFLKIIQKIKKVNPSVELKDLLFKKPRRGLI
ncbi:3'-5' exonuclease [Namhaeicola litoreus]|uniref:PolC-type DNA polymerase III n=1 Tax=Namhaeicola litoreus TaxID=1052145 RepID=A0ABW3Y2N8_9FLAO